jgi:hypothetical protein
MLHYAVLQSGLLGIQSSYMLVAWPENECDKSPREYGYVCSSMVVGMTLRHHVDR